MPLRGNWVGLEVRLVCSWLSLFPWVNSLKSPCLSFFLCKVQGLGELVSKGEDISRFVEHEKLCWLPVIRLLHHLLWKNNSEKKPTMEAPAPEVLPPPSKGESLPQTCLLPACISPLTPGSAMVPDSPAVPEAAPKNPSDQKWFSRKITENAIAFFLFALHFYQGKGRVMGTSSASVPSVPLCVVLMSHKGFRVVAVDWCGLV